MAKWGWESFMSKATICPALDSPRGKSEPGHLRLLGQAVAFINSTFIISLHSVYISICRKKICGSYVYPQRRGVFHYHYRYFPSAQESNGLDFENSLPARQEQDLTAVGCRTPSLSLTLPLPTSPSMPRPHLSQALPQVLGILSLTPSDPICGLTLSLFQVCYL